MERVIWTVTENNDNGCTPHVFTDKGKALAMLGDFADADWKDYYPNKKRPDDPIVALQMLYDQIGYFDSYSLEEHKIELPQPTTKVWSLATDDKNGTQVFTFKSETELNDHMWDNCVSDFELSIPALQTKYEGDYSAAIDDGHGSDMLTYCVDYIEIPVVAPGREVIRDAIGAIGSLQEQISQMSGIFNDDDNSIKNAIEAGDEAVTGLNNIVNNLVASPEKTTQFINRMAQFTTPEDEFKDDPQGYADAEELKSDYSDDRLCDDHSAFMHMVREAREILKGEKA